MAQASQSAERLSALIRRIYGRNPFYTRKLDAAGLDPASLSFPRDLSKLPLTTKRELIADQQASPPWGTNLSEPLEQVHALQPDVVDDGKPAALARHQRELAVDARVLEGCVRGRESRLARSDFLSVLVRAISRILDGVRGGLPDGRALHSGRRHVEPGALVDDRDAAADGHLLHADIRASTARGRRRDAAGAPTCPRARCAC